MLDFSQIYLVYTLFGSADGRMEEWQAVEARCKMVRESYARAALLLLAICVMLQK